MQPLTDDTELTAGSALDSRRVAMTTVLRTTDDGQVGIVASFLLLVGKSSNISNTAACVGHIGPGLLLRKSPLHKGKVRKST